MDGVSKGVLYISYDGMTDPLGQSQVIPYLRELTKLGYKFTLLSVEKKDRLKKSGQQVGQILADAGIEWETLPFTSRPPVFSKLYDQKRLNAKAVSLHKKKSFDLLHCRSYVATETGLRLSKRFNIPFLFDMRGFWVDERVDSGLWNLRNPLYRLFYKIYKKKEKKYFSQSAHIISLTQKGKEELMNVYNVAAEKISVIPCCADLSHFDYRKISNEKKQQVRDQLSINNNSKILTYLGSLGGWYMTGEMLDFFAVMKAKIPEAVFLLITHDSREQIISMAASKGIAASDIRVQPASRDEVPLYLSVSDWSIFFIKNVYSKKASSPTKQGEIMGMGIPLICNDIGDTGYIIKQTNSGILTNGFSNDNYNAISDTLDKLSHIRSEDIRHGAGLFFDLKKGVEQYLAAYKKVLS